MFISKVITLLAVIAPLDVIGVLGAKRPKQGVFLLSNQPENEVGVYESLDDGALSWVGAYKTGGIGYPEAEDADNFDSLGSSNAVSYFVWNDKQFIVAANAGGPTGEASISLMEIEPTTLDLTLVSKADMEGIFACSVAAFEDRVCAVACAGSVKMECFRIQEDTYDLVPEYEYDFGANIPPVNGRPNATSAAFGPGNVLFSGDGLQVGIIMKGDAVLTEEDKLTFSAPKAGFHSFPVQEDGYGAPSFLAIPDEEIPFAFTWRAGEVDTDKQIVLIVNIAGESKDFPECDETASCYSSVVTLETDFDTDGSIVIVKADEVNAGQIDLCWIDYRFLHFYTGNFLSDSITIGTVQRDGTLSIERNAPVGRGTVPNDVVHMGRKIDGSFFIYTENQGTAEVGVHRVIENESFQLEVMVGAPYPDGVTAGNAWIGSHGIAATLLSEEELFAMYDFEVDSEDDDESSASSFSSVLFAGFVWALLSML